MTIVAVYTFRSSEAADQALEQLWRKICGGFERSGGGQIWISSMCTDVYQAEQICQSHGGVAK